MADSQYLDVLRLGVEVWNDWYKAVSGGAELRGANLRCMDLAKVNFATARLDGADLRYSNLSGANLQNAQLEGVKLDRCNLRGACLKGATGLTAEQLGNAEGDASTALPWGLEPPAHWRSSMFGPDLNEVTVG